MHRRLTDSLVCSCLASLVACGSTEERPPPRADGDPVAPAPASGDGGGGSDAVAPGDGGSAPRPITYPPARNVVLVLLDDVGYDIEPFSPSQDIKTPRMAAFAQQSSRMMNFHSNGPICSPTRAALMTGLYPHHAGVYQGVPHSADDDPGLGLHAGLKLLPELLGERGYKTAIFGKWHLGGKEGGQHPNNPNARGFDDVLAFLGGAAGYAGGDDGVHDELFEAQGNTGLQPAGAMMDQHLTEIFTERAVSYIEKRRRDGEPFFLYLPYNAPHGNVQEGADWIRQRAKQQGPNGYYAGIVEGAYDGPDTCAAGSPKTCRENFAILLRHVDSQLGRVLDALEGIDDETLVLITADNGPEVCKWKSDPAPFSGRKGGVYEGGHRVPAMVRWPAGGIAEGTASSVLATTTDLFATILEATATTFDVQHVSRNDGGVLDRPVDGRSLLGVLRSDPGAAWPDRPRFWELRGRAAVTYGDHKLAGLVHDPGAGCSIDDPAWELYDFASTIAEDSSTDLSGDPALSVQQTEMRAFLDAWLSDLNAPRPPTPKIAGYVACLDDPAKCDAGCAPVKMSSLPLCEGDEALD